MRRRVRQTIGPELLEHHQSSIKQKINIKTKQNNIILPLYIMPDHRIIVFTQSPIFKKIYHHLKSICQPIYRPKLIHQYKITKFSLYTAMVLHYTGVEIVDILKRLCKNEDFPESLQTQIIQYMKHAGEVRFSLIDDQYFIYTTAKLSLLVEEFLEEVEQVKVNDIYNYHLDQISQEIQEYQENCTQKKQILGLQPVEEEEYLVYQSDEEKIIENNNQKLKREIKQKEKTLVKYKIKGDYFQVTKRFIQKNIPIVQQFNFQNCKQLPNIQVQMNSDVQLRFYQQAALKNVFIGGKARSGLIILPCGAGKSMVAIELIQRIKKKSIIFCENQTSAIQWKEEFIRWTTLERNKILILTSKYKISHLSQIQNCSVFITTYSMVGLKREKQNKFLEKTQQMSWGVCIADEVHKLPAETFQIVLQKYKFYLKIGLTATPYRQDKKINNLFYMIGPKLYQENWLDLVNQGCLAKPYCVQILCEMPPMFRQSYEKLNRAELIHTANPAKFKILQYLIKKHTHFGDKILIFCDRPKILQRYAKLLKKPFIHGGVSQEQRIHFYSAFKTIKQFNVLFLSRVGDTAIDLPCANVGIQIGMHYNSRRQEVQRMGRIMRPKDNPKNEFNAFFYTLISQDTDQVTFSSNRRRILIDQGFQHEIKEAKQLNTFGMRLQQLDEKEHLMFVLSQHEEGDILLSKGVLLDKRQTTKVMEKINSDDDYYYQQDIDQ